MNRRSFLKFLGIGAASITAGASLLEKRQPAVNAALKPAIKPRAQAKLGEVWGDYGQHFYESERAYDPVAMANADSARMAGEIYRYVSRRSPYADLIS